MSETVQNTTQVTNRKSDTVFYLVSKSLTFNDP